MTLIAALTEPNWLANRHHLIAGAILSFVIVLLARRWINQPWVALLLGVTVTATVELALELIEYPILFSGPPETDFYYDVLADIGMTFVGGIAGTIAAGLFIWLRQHKPS